MKVLRYNESGTIRALKNLPVIFRVTFAATCAERLKLSYYSYAKRIDSKDPGKLDVMLQLVWSSLIGDVDIIHNIDNMINQCMTLIPDEDDGVQTTGQFLAEDASASVAYTLRALKTGEAQEAAWAARRAYEALDYHVTNTLGIADGRQALRHPLIQAELARQGRDLSEMSKNRNGKDELIIRLRNRSNAESHLFYLSEAEGTNSFGNATPGQPDASWSKTINDDNNDCRLKRQVRTRLEIKKKGP